MRTFSKAGIAGAGLIGGSIGIDLKKKRIARRVVAVGRHKGSLSIAKRKKAVDEGSRDPAVLEGCDLVILAAPVETIIKQAGLLKRHIPDDCIVMDVASTKETIVKKMSRIFPRFVGCHPLAGSEKRGIANARGGLFHKADCIITPVKATDAGALAAVKDLWVRLGAKPVIMDPSRHDRMLAYTSHLPHVMAFALIDALPAEYLARSPRSFRDMTRIAGSSPELWDDICMTNRANLGRSIGAFTGRMQAVRAAIRRGDKAALRRIMKRAHAKRSNIL